MFNVRWMRVGWYFAMVAVTVLALMLIEHMQLPVFDWCDMAQHALAYGAGIEAAQWAIGWRFVEWADLAADAVGVSVAWIVVSSWWRFQSHKQERAFS